MLDSRHKSGEYFQCMRSAWRSGRFALQSTRRAGRDRQAAWENPRQCGKPAGGTRRFSDDCSPGISPAIRSISPAACSPLGDHARDDLTFGPGPFRGDTFTASREIRTFKVGLNYRFGSLFGGGYGGSY